MDRAYTTRLDGNSAKPHGGRTAGISAGAPAELGRGEQIK